MPASHKAQTTAADRIAAELQRIKASVTGVIGSITATSDGLVVAHDLAGLEPTQIAALVAAMQALALRATLATGCGQFQEVVTRGSEGYLAVYAAGRGAVVAVMGSSRLNVGMLNYQTRRIVERIAEHSADLERPLPAETAAAAPASGTPASRAAASDTAASDGTHVRDDVPQPLPVRRPRPRGPGS